MGFKPAHPKFGGRVRQLAAREQHVNDIAERLDVDPFEVLLMFAKGDWSGLGYKSESTTKWTASGIEYEEETITPLMRLKAASDAVQYMRAKKKSVEVKAELTAEEQMALDLFREKLADFRAHESARPVDASSGHGDAPEAVGASARAVPGPDLSGSK